MRRHELDSVSLAAGLLFLVVAAVHIAARSTDTELNLRWMVPAVLVLLGVLGLLSAIRSPRGGADDLAKPADHVEVPQRFGPADHEATERVERNEPVKATQPVEATEPVQATEPVEAGVLGEVDEASTER